MKAIVRCGWLLSVFCTAGCASETSVFHKAEGDQTGVCTVSAMGLIPMAFAMSQYSKCREAYLKAGYVEGPPP
jgi:hypothetical protein